MRLLSQFLPSRRRYGGIFFAVANVFLAPAAPAPEIIELPKFVVTDSRELPPPESWRYAELPGFEILTNGSERETRKLLWDFQLFNIAIGVVWPDIQPPRTVPIALIICGKGGKFGAFLPADSPADAGRVSLFLQDREQAAIVLDFETKNVRTDAAALAAAGASAATAAAAASEDGEGESAAGAPDTGEIRVDHYQQLYREYCHYLMSGVQPRLPAWLEEGFAQLFMGMKFDLRTITFAQLESSQSGPAADPTFNRALQGHALLPLQEFFSVTRDSPTAINPVGSLWAKQAQAFVHLCLYGEGQRYQKAFIAFVLRLQHEPPSEALFKDCFHMSYKSMGATLASYRDFTAYRTYKWRLKKGQTLPAPPAVTFRDATPAEVGRIKGEALRLAGRNDAAHLALIAPYLRGEKDPRLLAALGLEESAEGHSDRAEKFLMAAASLSRARAAALRRGHRGQLRHRRENPSAATHRDSRAALHRAESAAADARGLSAFGPGLVALRDPAETGKFPSHHGGREAVSLRGGTRFPGRDPRERAAFHRGSDRSCRARPPRRARPRRPKAFRNSSRCFTRSSVCPFQPFFSPMIRKAFVMSVHPGQEPEYTRRHQPIWPELAAVLTAHGVHNYSIFLHPETRQLFAYAEIEDEARWAAIAQTDVCRRWWKYMSPLMPGNPDHSPVARDLPEVFHLD